MPDFTGFAMRTFLRGSNPSLSTNKGLQETADPFVLSAVPRNMENDNLDIIVIIGFWDLNSEA